MRQTFTTFLLLGVAACSNGDDASCPRGTAACPCYDNGACDSGLECRASLCVREAGDAGGDAAAGDGTNGDPSASGVRLSWRFNYRDYKDALAPDDVRDCTNEPPVNRDPPYDDVVDVALISKPLGGGVPLAEQSISCASGSVSTTEIMGLPQQAQLLELEARAADGTVLYGGYLDDFDPSAGAITEDVELATTTGEISFFARFSGALNCPGDVVALRVAMFRKVGGVVPVEPTLVVMHSPACEAGASREVFLRALPVSFESPLESHNDYHMIVEALDGSDNTLYCAVNPSRLVRLGDNSLAADETLFPGVCP